MFWLHSASVLQERGRHAAILLPCCSTLRASREDQLCIFPQTQTATDRLQKWHVPPKSNIAPQPLSNMEFHKELYEKQVHTKRHAAPLAHQQNLLALSQLVEKMNHAYPGSGLAHFWTLPDMQGGDSGELVSAQVATESDIVDGLVLLARKLVISTSIPHQHTTCRQSTLKEYFQELCHEYVIEQVIDQQLSDFVENETSKQSDSMLWKKLHYGRITSSSVFGEVCRRRDETSPISICKCLMGYTSVSAS